MLSTTYKEYILEKLLLEHLYDGDIPTADELEEELISYQETTHANLERPLSNYVDFSVEHGNNSSAALIQSISATVSQDIGVITREIYKVAKDNSKFYDRWISEIKRLSFKARQLEDRIDSLLLLEEDTVGFFAHVGDTFYNLKDVDTSLTTALLNTRNGTVSINPDTSSDGSGGNLINLTNMAEREISFKVLTRKPGVSNYVVSEKNSLVQLFKNRNSSWVHKVISTSGGEISAELKANLSSLDIEVTDISIEYTGPDSVGSSTVTCLYSVDGYKWILAPVEAATKSLSRKITWSFVPTDLKWIKFIFVKSSPDNSNNEYIFSASSIKVYNKQYSISTDTSSSVLISNALYEKNTEDNNIGFSTVALDACKELHVDTSLLYYVSASIDNSIWSNWYNILPRDSEEILYPKIVNFSGSDWTDNSDSALVTLFDESTADLANMKLTKDFTSTTLDPLGVDLNFEGYKFKDDTFKVVNAAININDDEDIDGVSNTVEVWRNMRYKNVSNYPDILTVRDVPRGWSLDGGLYSCYFKIINSDGIVIDFGDGGCSIDSRPISGSVKISSGVHKFVTKASNWFDISADINSPIVTEEQLKVIDTLYPFNHKLLIEGFLYPSGSFFAGERIYTGTDLSAAYFATRTSLFDLENNPNDFGRFALRSVSSSENKALAVILKYNASNPDNGNELFYVRWKTDLSASSLFKYVKFKTEFKTSDSGKTPILTSYRLRLGV